MKSNTNFLTLVALVLSCLMLSCGSDPEACETEGFGYITFNNLVDNAVEITINGNAIGSVGANSTIEHKTASGQVVIEAKEDKLILPEKWDINFFLESCEEIEQVFEP